MKWVPVKQSSATVQKYHLVNDALTEVVLKYNNDQQSARIGIEDNKRLFFLERTGIWNNKIIFKSEYGVEVGKLSFDKGYHAGTIDMADKKYNFTIQDRPEPVMIIYKQHISKPFAICDLAFNIEVLTQTAENHTIQQYASLLLGLCWYLLPVNAIEKLALATNLSPR